MGYLSLVLTNILSHIRYQHKHISAHINNFLRPWTINFITYKHTDCPTDAASKPGVRQGRHQLDIPHIIRQAPDVAG